MKHPHEPSPYLNSDAAAATGIDDAVLLYWSGELAGAEAARAAAQTARPGPARDLLKDLATLGTEIAALPVEAPSRDPLAVAGAQWEAEQAARARGFLRRWQTPLATAASLAFLLAAGAAAFFWGGSNTDHPGPAHGPASIASQTSPPTVQKGESAVATPSALPTAGVDLDGRLDQLEGRLRRLRAFGAGTSRPAAEGRPGGLGVRLKDLRRRLDAAREDLSAGLPPEGDAAAPSPPRRPPRRVARVTGSRPFSPHNKSNNNPGDQTS